MKIYNHDSFKTQPRADLEWWIGRDPYPILTRSEKIRNMVQKDLSSVLNLRCRKAKYYISRWFMSTKS
jgi:hypothetical protein